MIDSLNDKVGFEIGVDGLFVCNYDLVTVDGAYCKIVGRVVCFSVGALYLLLIRAVEEQARSCWNFKVF